MASFIFISLLFWLGDKVCEYLYFFNEWVRLGDITGEQKNLKAQHKETAKLLKNTSWHIRKMMNNLQEA